MNIATKLIAALAAVAIGALAAYLAMPQRPVSAAPIVTLDGEKFTLGELHGKVTVVKFWATWCGECMREMPKAVEAHRRYAGRGYETVAIAVRDEPARVTQFAAQANLPFRVALDWNGELARRFGDVRATPTTFVIDREGHVLKRFVGEPDWAVFDRVVEQALSKASRPSG